MTDIEYLKKYYNGNINNAIKRLEMGEPVQYIVCLLYTSPSPRD